jgi:acyl dehydratase
MSLESALHDLQAEIGTETRVSEWFEVTQQRVDQFADATADHQWIHVDAEKAAAGPFGGTIAHGFFTLALIPFLGGHVDQERPRFPDQKMGINYGVNKVRFPAPVAVGSYVRARITLNQAEAAKGGIQIVSTVIIEIKDQPKPACVAETVSLIFF